MIAAGEKEAAYRRVTACMDKIPVDLVADLTRELMNSDFRYLEHSGEQIPIPHIDPGMISLMEVLRKNRFEIYIISASNQVSVRVIGEEYLGLDPGRIFGIDPETGEDRMGRKILTENLKEPAPVNSGKAELYRTVIGGELPLLTAGDSELDFPMLDLVAEGGIVLWRGDEGGFSRLKEQTGERAEVISLKDAGFPGEGSQ